MISYPIPLLTDQKLSTRDADVRWFMPEEDEWRMSVQTDSNHDNIKVINLIGEVAGRIYGEHETRTWKDYDSFNCKNSSNRMSDYTSGVPIVWTPNHRDKFNDVRRALAYREAVVRLRDTCD